MKGLTPLGLAREAEHQQRLRDATDLLASLDVDDLRRFGVLVNAFPAALAGKHFGDALIDSAAAEGMPVPAQDADPVPWADTELAALVRSLDVVIQARGRLG